MSSYLHTAAYKQDRTTSFDDMMTVTLNVAILYMESCISNASPVKPHSVQVICALGLGGDAFRGGGHYFTLNIVNIRSSFCSLKEPIS